MEQALDLAIVGGGCAGLSLACELERQQDRHSKLSVMIIEPRLVHQHDRTWCFWARKLGADKALVAHSWPAWRFSTVTLVWSRRCLPALKMQRCQTHR